MSFRLQDLDTLEVRDELKNSPATVMTRVQESLDEAHRELSAAGEALRAAQAAKESGFQKLLALNREYAAVKLALKNSKQLALAGDLPTMWTETRKNRERLLQLADLVAYQTLWNGPAEALAVLEKEIAFEDARATWHEMQAVEERAKAYRVALDLRAVSPGSSVDVSDSVSARLLKNVERIRRETVPAMLADAGKLQGKLEQSRAEATGSLFG